jgi:hypothetical protein
MVPSATSLRSFNLHMKPGDAAAVLIIELLPMNLDQFLSASSSDNCPTCGSDPCLLAKILVIFPPAALALANGFVIRDELDCADVLHHRESKLRFNAEPERRSVQYR